MTTMSRGDLPVDVAVQCHCGGTVPLVLFVYDGRPHNQATCPTCEHLVFLGAAPHVRRAS
jgi:hypothetical protein